MCRHFRWAPARAYGSPARPCLLTRATVWWCRLDPRVAAWWCHLNLPLLAAAIAVCQHRAFAHLRWCGDLRGRRPRQRRGLERSCRGLPVNQLQRQLLKRRYGELHSQQRSHCRRIPQEMRCGDVQSKLSPAPRQQQYQLRRKSYTHLHRLSAPRGWLQVFPQGRRRQLGETASVSTVEKLNVILRQLFRLREGTGLKRLWLLLGRLSITRLLHAKHRCGVAVLWLHSCVAGK